MAAHNELITLNKILTQQKPLVRCSFKGYRNSISDTWPKLAVSVWNEFTFTSLNDEYGGLLNKLTPGPLSWPNEASAGLTGLVITNSLDLNHLLRWNDEVVRQALPLAKAELGLHPGTGLHHQFSTPENSTKARLLNTSVRLTVDHVIALDENPIRNLVVGLAKPSSKFRGRELASQLPDPTIHIMSPLQQLARICEVAKTPFGYIQTDEELVVCQFNQVNEECYARFMPIPWSTHGDGVLTSDLALWWLCVKAISDLPQRAVVVHGGMVPTGNWGMRTPLSPPPLLTYS